MSTLSATLQRAREIAALVAPFSPDVKVIYDPNKPLPEGLTWQGPRDQQAGFIPMAPAGDVPADTIGSFSIMGHVNGRDLAFPTDPNAVFTVTPTGFLFVESAVQLDEQHALLEQKGEAGHPLRNNGIKFGDNLVAQQSGDDKCVLLWASLPYTAKYQVQA